MSSLCHILCDSAPPYAISYRTACRNTPIHGAAHCQKHNVDLSKCCKIENIACFLFVFLLKQTLFMVNITNFGRIDIILSRAQPALVSGPWRGGAATRIARSDPTLNHPESEPVEQLTEVRARAARAKYGPAALLW